MAEDDDHYGAAGYQPGEDEVDTGQDTPDTGAVDEDTAPDEDGEEVNAFEDENTDSPQP